MLLQNIYRSEEFLETAPHHNMSVPHLNSNSMDHPGRHTEALVKGQEQANSNVIIPAQFDENSELADEEAAKNQKKQTTETQPSALENVAKLPKAGQENSKEEEATANLATNATPDTHAVSNKEIKGQPISVSPGSKNQQLGLKSIKELVN